MNKKEKKWCDEHRMYVIEYLEKEGVNHGKVGEIPSWDVIPYTSIWAIESKKFPGSVGWWVVCGDHPTDYVSSKDIKNPRKAYEAIANQWLDVCNRKDKKAEHPTVKIELKDKEQIQMLRQRAETFLAWVEDESNWKK